MNAGRPALVEMSVRSANASSMEYLPRGWLRVIKKCSHGDVVVGAMVRCPQALGIWSDRILFAKASLMGADERLSADNNMERING